MSARRGNSSTGKYWFFGILLTSPIWGGGAFVIFVAMMVAMANSQTAPAQAATPAGGTSGSTLRDDAPIPAQVRDLIIGAVRSNGCGALTESVLAAQLYQESGFDPRAQSGVGAQGIAQFMPGTWPGYGKDENGNGVASPWEPEDAIPAAARYDCTIAKQVAEVPGDAAENMLAGYNAGPGAVLKYGGVPPYDETQKYVRIIIAKAKEWAIQPGEQGAGSGDAPSAPPAPTVPQVERTGNRTIDTAVAWAVAQIGTWYQWGGRCTDPHGPDAMGRCDCSSLMQQAYAHAGVALPRTAHEQQHEGQAIPLGDVQPGDLIPSAGSDGSSSYAGHIAMYIGNGYLVEAPYTGAKVQLNPIRGYPGIISIRRIVTG